VVGVLKLAESSVDFAVRPWVKTEDYGDVSLALTEAIKKRFDAEGLSIPFPQRDVHLYKHEA
jgi:small conductance mechanosensitive channel